MNFHTGFDRIFYRFLMFVICVSGIIIISYMIDQMLSFH